jgi:DNA-binding MarR family transcriptional regulator
MTDSSKAAPLDADEKALIRALRPAMAAMMRAFDEDLRSQGLSHTEYIALMFLSEAPDRTLRLSDLAEMCQQSASALGRTVRRLEADTLVSREQSGLDARSFNAVLTDAGLARLERAWPVHIASVRRHLFDQLEGIELGKLAIAFQRIAEAPPVPTRTL